MIGGSVCVFCLLIVAFSLFLKKRRDQRENATTDVLELDKTHYGRVGDVHANYSSARDCDNSNYDAASSALGPPQGVYGGMTGMQTSNYGQAPSVSVLYDNTMPLSNNSSIVYDSPVVTPPNYEATSQPLFQ